MRASRERRDDSLLEWKVRAFTVAAVLALAGMYFEARWMTGMALTVLVVAMVARLVVDRGSRSTYLEDDETSEESIDDRPAESPDTSS